MRLTWHIYKAVRRSAYHLDRLTAICNSNQAKHSLSSLFSHSLPLQTSKRTLYSRDICTHGSTGVCLRPKASLGGGACVYKYGSRNISQVNPQAMTKSITTYSRMIKKKGKKERVLNKDARVNIKLLHNYLIICYYSLIAKELSDGYILLEEKSCLILISYRRGAWLAYALIHVTIFHKYIYGVHLGHSMIQGPYSHPLYFYPFSHSERHDRKSASAQSAHNVLKKKKRRENSDYAQCNSQGGWIRF